MIIFNDPFTAEEDRDKLLKSIREQGTKAREDLEQIIDFIGGSNFSTTKNGIIIGESIANVAQMFERLQLYHRITGEDILQHPVRVVKKGQEGSIKDITTRIVEIFHDVPERTPWYKEYKKKFKEKRFELPRDIYTYQKIKKNFINELGNFILSLEQKYNVGIDVERAKRCISRITRNPYDTYDIFLNKIWGISPINSEYEFDPIDIVITGIPKIEDCDDNNSKIPREKYTTEERIRIGIKGVLTINAANIFIEQHRDVPSHYISAIRETSKNLNNTIKENALDDIGFLRENHSISPLVFDKIDNLFEHYDDFGVRELASPEKLEVNNSSLFDGYLRRQLLIVNKKEWNNKYQNLFTKQNKWIKKHFGIRKKHVKTIRDYSDAVALYHICNYFEKPNILKGLCEVNRKYQMVYVDKIKKLSHCEK